MYPQREVSSNEYQTYPPCTVIEQPVIRIRVGSNQYITFLERKISAVVLIQSPIPDHCHLFAIR
jgi:hypothetical protein